MSFWPTQLNSTQLDLIWKETQKGNKIEERFRQFNAKL